MYDLPPFEMEFSDYVLHPLSRDDIERLQELCDQCSDYNSIVEGEPVSPTAAQ